jgi:hypothetical protein
MPVSCGSSALQVSFLQAHSHSVMKYKQDRTVPSSPPLKSSPYSTSNTPSRPSLPPAAHPNMDRRFRTCSLKATINLPWNRQLLPGAAEISSGQKSPTNIKGFQTPLSLQIFSLANIRISSPTIQIARFGLDPLEIIFISN